MSRRRRRANPSDTDYTLPGLIVLASVAISAYHGTKRNNGSIGFGLLWGVAGGVAPIITPVIAFAQGYAKPLVAGQLTGPGSTTA